MLNFHSPNCKIILTAKFFQSVVPELSATSERINFNTIDWEIFTLKIKKYFCGVKILQFHSIPEIFVAVDRRNRDKRLELYCEVLGEPGIAI